MATIIYKVLGQSTPGAMSQSTIVAPSGVDQVDVLSFVACNHSEVLAKYRISVRSAAGEFFLQYQSPIGPNETISTAYQITLGPGDAINVYSTTGTVDFSAFGFIQRP